jgi:hypothetical protein
MRHGDAKPTLRGVETSSLTKNVRRPHDRFHVLEGMALIAGLALAFWLFGDVIRERWEDLSSNPHHFDPVLANRLDTLVWFGAVALLGGLSSVGVPLLVVERILGPDRRWGTGRVLWFVHGLAGWLLWPAMVFNKVAYGIGGLPDYALMVYVIASPLLGLVLFPTLFLRLRSWRRARRAIGQGWREQFGLALGLAWACAGLYLLAMIYRFYMFGD